MMSAWRDERGRLMVDLGAVGEEDAAIVTELFAALGRAANGNAAAALVAWARERRARGRRAGCSRVSFHEAGGDADSRPGRWVAESELAERRRTG